MSEIKETDAFYSYNMHIKEKLNNWRKRYQEEMHGELNFSAIADKMNNDFHINTSEQKIRAMFNMGNDREVKLAELIAFTQIFNIPIGDICDFPTSAANSSDVSSLLRSKQHLASSKQNFSDNFYKGKYYCYYFKPKHYSDKLHPVDEYSIEESILYIDIQDGHTTLTLEEQKSTTKFYGGVMDSFTLSGKLYLLDNPNIAYSFINDPTGRRSMALMFKYLNLSADIRYYITAGMMTMSLNQIHEPLFQKMAIFRVRQDLSDPANTDIIRGILTLNTAPIILDKETQEKLIEESPELTDIISKEKALKECYLYPSSSIQSNLYSIIDNDEKIRTLLKLRKNSLYPAHEIISETDAFADFIKNYQCSHKNYNEEDGKQ